MFELVSSWPRAGLIGAVRPEKNPKRGSRHGRFQAGSCSERAYARLSFHEPLRAKLSGSEWVRAVLRGQKRTQKEALDIADFRRVLAERVALHGAVRSGLEAASGEPKVVSSCSERCFAVLAGSWSRGGSEVCPKSVRSLSQAAPKNLIFVEEKSQGLL